MQKKSLKNVYEKPELYIYGDIKKITGKGSGGGDGHSHKGSGI